MKLTKQTAPMVKEWADMVLFCNYKTFAVNVDGQGAQKGKNKAQGGKRVMYTTHHSCWDAKNRYGLADEVPLSMTASGISSSRPRRAHHPRLRNGRRRPQPLKTCRHPRSSQSVMARTLRSLQKKRKHRNLLMMSL